MFYKTDLAVFDYVKDQPEIFQPFSEGIRVCIARVCASIPELMFRCTGHGRRLRKGCRV